MVRLRRVDDETVLGREDAEVRVGTHRDAALPRQPHEVGGPLGHPARHVGEAENPLARLGPDDREPELQRADSSPREPEVTRVQRLELRGRWRVVGHDDVEGPVSQPVPEPLPVVGLPDRWAALELGRPLGHFLVREVEVVRARLRRDADALVLGGGDERQRLGGRDVQDVDPASRVPGEVDDVGDGDVLGLPRAGREEVAVAAALRARRGRPLDRLRVLRVDDEQAVERGDPPHHVHELRQLEVGTRPPRRAAGST